MRSCRTAPGGSATWARQRGVERVGLVDVNSEAVPMLLFGSGFAGPAVRAGQLPARRRPARRRSSGRTAPSVVVVEDAVPARVGAIDGVELVTRAQFLARARRSIRRQCVDGEGDLDPEDIAILLFTSGTTGDPKAAVLRHRHLGLVRHQHRRLHGCRRGRGGAGERAAVPRRRHVGRHHRRLRRTPRRVPPGVHAGGVGRRRRGTRRSPRRWSCRRCSGGSSTCSSGQGESLPHLRHLSYGGGRMPDAGDRAGAAPAAARRLRQRLRAHRDELDHRRARS